MQFVHGLGSLIARSLDPFVNSWDPPIYGPNYQQTNAPGHDSREPTDLSEINSAVDYKSQDIFPHLEECFKKLRARIEALSDSSVEESVAISLRRAVTWDLIASIFKTKRNEYANDPDFIEWSDKWLELLFEIKVELRSLKVNHSLFHDLKIHPALHDELILTQERYNRSYSRLKVLYGSAHKLIKLQLNFADYQLPRYTGLLNYLNFHWNELIEGNDNGRLFDLVDSPTNNYVSTTFIHMNISYRKCRVVGFDYTQEEEKLQMQVIVHMVLEQLNNQFQFRSPSPTLNPTPCQRGATPPFETQHVIKAS